MNELQLTLVVYYLLIKIIVSMKNYIEYPYDPHIIRRRNDILSNNQSHYSKSHFMRSTSTLEANN